MKKNIERKGSLLSSSRQESLGEKRAKLFKQSNGNLEDKIKNFFRILKICSQGRRRLLMY